MKKQLYRIAFWAMAVVPTISVLNSCKDAYEIVQEGELDDEAVFSNMDNINSYLIGVYGYLGLFNEIKFTSVFTDEVGIGPANSGQDVSLHRFNLTSGESYSASMWSSHYILIDRVNRFLRGVEYYTPKATEEVAYKNAIAQAKTLRAFAYLQLESYFSTDMKDPNALGVMYSDHVQKLDVQLPRSTNAEIYKLIESDLAYAEANLNSTVTVPANYPAKYMLANINFVNAIRARFYLYRGDFVNAKKYAEKVVNESGLSLTEATPLVPSTVTANIGSVAWNNNFYGTATVNPVNPYRKMWLDREQGEIIFALSQPAIGTFSGIAGLYTTNSTTAGGSVLFDMGRNLFNIINSNSGDLRRYAFVDPTSKFQADYETSNDYVQKDVIVIDKYPGKLGTTYVLKNDVKVFRLSEMYFILAECAVENNDFDTAANYVKKVRDARNYLGPVAKPTYADKAEAYRDVLVERRVELAFEGHRYLDLKRLGQIAGVAIDRNKTDDAIPTLPTTIPYDYRFTLPIPLDEIRANKVIQQNPGY